MNSYPVLTAVLAALSMIVGVAWYALRRTFATTERVERLENRLTEIETRHASAPRAEDMHELRLQIADMGGEIKALNQQMRAISHQLGLLLENAVNGSKQR